MHEAAALQADLRRAGIEPYAWVVNQSLGPLAIADPLLLARQAQDLGYLDEVAGRHASRVYVVPWRDEAGADRAARSQRAAAE